MRMKLAIEELLLLLHKSIKERALHEVQPSLFSILSEGVKKKIFNLVADFLEITKHQSILSYMQSKPSCPEPAGAAS